MIDAWQNQIKEASARGAKLTLRGAGTKEGMGEFESTAGVPVLDTRAYAGVVAYEPDELVITVRCGTPLAGVEATMRAANQMLAFEAPFAAQGATMGGVVASGLSGPRRPWAGAVRDFVLGVKLIDGKGDHHAFGGQVMKNVAGFDVSRLQCGAWGTLGLLTEMSFKCLPLPKAQTTLRFEIDATTFLKHCAGWASQPLPISGAAWVDGIARVRLSGAEAAVKSAQAKLGGESHDDDAWWVQLKDMHLPWFTQSGEALWRLSVKSTAPLRDNENVLIDWAGAQRFVRVPPAQHESLRKWASEQGGHATLLCQQAHGVPRFQPITPALAAIQTRLKTTFDPYNIFNVGRMGGGA
jgi:glycolate oxidase FAD binding subunit